MSRRFNNVRQYYKDNFGEEPAERELYLHLYRSKGKYIIDEDTSILSSMIMNINNGLEIQIWVPDEDYIEWLESIVEEFLKINHANLQLQK
jgi:hypothetical protein